MKIKEVMLKWTYKGMTKTRKNKEINFIKIIKYKSEISQTKPK